MRAARRRLWVPSYFLSPGGPTVAPARAAAGFNLRNRGVAMLHYAVVFFVIALIAAVFGFTGIAAGAAGIAKILFVLFLIVAVVTFLLSLGRRA
jgi:uncharacterized membrane protein YtjA (UPF0391 family)